MVVFTDAATKYEDKGIQKTMSSYVILSKLPKKIEYDKKLQDTEEFIIQITNYLEEKTVTYGEFISILHALHWIKKHYPETKEVTVYSDSEVSCNSINKWMKGWQKNGWKNSIGQEIHNKDLIVDYYDNFVTKKPFKIKVEHVKAHTKKDDVISCLNRYVDNLAVETLKTFLG